ncbi:MAG: hypothetical protein K5798_06570 [Nitrosopumilus sp.]|uniref:hypothetical protein n=1 Tax=Nitrosopumilus sp. TaxID=2024843 RepID=UPI00242C2E4F|nr:hypothetical protein [Nitrosopumilus sp.]MCV0366906.1 hypothetical protein [Nitrosopumilus sp.]
MTKKIPLTFFLAIILLFGGNVQSSSAQNLEALSEYSIKLAISPSHLESGVAEHQVGYLFVLSKHGVPITSSYDVPVSLSSDDPLIASVPTKTVLKANEEFVSFPITTGEKSGKTTITASLNGKTTFQKIEVGTDETYLPDDMTLELNMPTTEMHVNSQMPFTVFFKTADDTIVRAPNDIEIVLEHNDLLASPDSDTLIIKKGNYYAWGVLTSHEKTGNTFVRAIHEESGLDVAKSIKISSTLPASLKLSVHPKLIPAEFDRALDIFVTVVDSDGNPTKTPEDIPLEFFSNEQFPIGDVLVGISKSEKPMIKKGEFGYLLQEKFSLQNLLKNDILIGVSSKGYGTATDTFRTVGESIEEGNKLKRTMKNVFNFGFDVKDYGNTVNVFGIENVPSNATAFFTYQLSMIEDDEDDDGIRPDGSLVEINPECAEQSDDTSDPDSSDVTHNTELDSDKIILYSIDCLGEGELYPMQSIENLYTDGFVHKINVISSDEKLAKIVDGGKILTSYSFGTAKVSTGQKTGPVTISTSINGVGTGSFTTNVVNALEQKEVRLFSPTGEGSLIFDRDGYFDIFLIALDGQQRPKVMTETGKYLVTPTNGLVEINKGTAFTFTQLRSDSFDISVAETQILLTVEPIGENADLKLGGSKVFTTQPSSQIQVTLPLSKINTNHQENLGIIQLVDLQGNPVIPKFNVKSKIVSSQNSIVQIIDDSVIPAGSSYTTFPIKTTGSVGNAIISASAKGVNGTSTMISTASSQLQLQISTGNLVDVIKVDDPVEFRLFVDDENLDSVPGASLKIVTKGDGIITPEVVRTSSDGSAIVSLTAFEGPNLSFDIIATAEGYAEGKDTFTVNVDSPENTIGAIDLELPEWIVYIVIGGILMIGIVVFLFLKKSKADLEEDWEEEEEI